jgi:hypothetical protein
VNTTSATELLEFCLGVASAYSAALDEAEP